MDNNSRISAPILIIAFNRPDVSKKTFEYIRMSKPAKLYIAIDGPRLNKTGEEVLVTEVKDILHNVDWECEVHYKINEYNKGAEITVSSAIDWVFETEDYAIILEDDIIASYSFLKFAQEMLIRYKDDRRIGTVTGSNFTTIPTPGDSDYFFAKYGHSWGWATWKRAWEGFDLNIQVPEEHLKISFLRTITNSNIEAKYYRKKFLTINENGSGNNTWDYIGLYHFRVNDLLSIIPKVNLTSNIGTYGLHANGETEHHFRVFYDNFVINKHPNQGTYFKEYDIHHFNTYIFKRGLLLPGIIRKVKRKLFR